MYGIGIKVGSRWSFMTYPPGERNKFGTFHDHVHRFPGLVEAASVIVRMKQLAEFDEKTKAWIQTLKVFEIPQDAIDKWEQAKAILAWCDANPKVEGSTENSLFHRGFEIGIIRNSGFEILENSLKAQFPD